MPRREPRGHEQPQGAGQPDPSATQPDPPIGQPGSPADQPDPPTTQPDPPATQPDPQAGSVSRALAYGLVLVLAVLLAVWGAFLVPVRVGPTPVSLSWLIAGVGNVVLVRAAGVLAGRLPAAVPALLWLIIATTLGAVRAEGDLIVPGTAQGLGFLIIGALAAAATLSVPFPDRTAEGRSRVDGEPPTRTR